MIILDSFEQRTPEWDAARLGCVTASELDKILSPVKLEKSTQATGYRYRLLAEFVTGRPCRSYSNDSMQRGQEAEQEAREMYSFITDQEIKQVGFVYKDDSRLIGCSPDGIIEADDGRLVSGVEIKAPEAQTQIGYLLSDRLPREYILQVQGSMWITGAKTWGFFSYHPELKPLNLVVRRDEKIISAINDRVEEFIAEMLRDRETLAARTFSVRQQLEASLSLVGARE